MAINGSGTEQDPYIITTYDELVEKASESEAYLKIDNDINITDEYPDGDMPVLNIASVIDGNGKKISNWYRTNDNYCITIAGATSQVYNLTFANIYCKPPSFREFIHLSGYNENYHFVSCKFRGICFYPLFDAADSYGSRNNFSSCSFYIDSKYGEGALLNNNWGYVGMRYCYVKVTGVSNSLFGTSRQTFADSCYFDCKMQVGIYDKLTNCVLDMQTNATFTANGSSSNALNIINSDHAPNATAGTGYALVDDEHWLDVDYLNSIGFNAG